VNLPNALTILRIFLVPLLIAVLFSTSLPNRELYGAAIFLAAAFTDLFDGYIARRRRQVTTLGILLDPIADKLLISAAFISLVALDPRLVPAWIAVVIIGREFAVTGLRSVAASRGVIIAANELGKAKMVLQVIAVTMVIVAHRYGTLHLLGLSANVRFWAGIALGLVVALAILSALSYFRRFWRAIQRDVAVPPIVSQRTERVAAPDVVRRG
jgi:CDP-diacylglycerol--glycerol-3-phosphate 3-phosphatidyltransferase